MKFSIKGLLSATAVAAVLSSGAAHAGPFILAGTDADDHGFESGGANIDGWFFMQRAIENLASASSLTNSNMVVANLGSTGGTAEAAATSAFNLSSLPGAGWSFQNVDGVANLNGFFDGTGAVNVNNVSIIMMDSSSSNVFGGTDSSELAVFTANATVIDTFLGNGGGLFSQSNGYGWVTSLIPGLTAIGDFQTGIDLTPAGSAAFPGLSSGDLSAGPYHNRFENFGALTVLGESAVDDEAIIIGAAGGSVSNPDPVPMPLPAPIALLAGGLAALGLVRRQSRGA